MVSWVLTEMDYLHQLVLIYVGGVGVPIRVSRAAGSGEGVRWSLSSSIWLKFSHWTDEETEEEYMLVPVSFLLPRELFVLLCPSLHSLCLLSGTSITTLKQWTMRWHLFSVR